MSDSRLFWFTELFEQVKKGTEKTTNGNCPGQFL